jgi:hypothetical protein
MTPQRGSGLLADDLFLLAHNDVTGKPRLHPRVAGIGLAGALLGELALFNRVDIRSGAMAVVDPRPIPDKLANSVLRQMEADARVRPVSAWLTRLAPTTNDSVAARLAEAGLLNKARSGLLRRETWAPTDMSAAAWPATRLRSLLTRYEPLTVPDATLAGFAVACGLVQQVLWDTVPDIRRYLDYVVANLADPLRDLIAQTETAVGNAVMSRPL